MTLDRSSAPVIIGARIGSVRLTGASVADGPDAARRSRWGSMTDVAAARGATLSSSLCAEALAALDRIFAMACPDEPDLGHNVTYVSARQWLRRLAATEPWPVPPARVRSVRRALAAAWSTDDPRALEVQLGAFRARVIARLDRRIGRSAWKPPREELAPPA